MLQLYAYDDTGARWELDLYDEDPVRLTISAEDIIDIPRIDSAFSRQFRVPATQNNSRFFKYWYTSGIADFDITQKIRSDIYVDGLFYTSGQLRIENVYINEEENRIDFELLFFAATKDFASQVGEGFMSDLDTTEISHNLTAQAVQNSWLNFGDPSLFLDGKLRWILADRGHNYQSNGDPVEPSEINLNNHSWSGGGTFVRSADPLPLNMFTPIVQVKYLIDKMFANTDYTYSADSFFNSQLFKFLYTDGVNVAQPTINGVDLNVETIKDTTQYLPSGIGQQLVTFTEVIDPAGAFDSSVYTVQLPIVGGTVDVQLDYYAQRASTSFPVTMTIQVEKNGVLVGTPYVHSDVADISGTAIINVVANFAQGDVIRVTAGVTNAATAFTGPGTFNIGGMGTAITGSELMKNDVKQLDFFRSILTRFRLVMVPNKNNPSEFIIKPWVDYIATGDMFDWTDKIDDMMDVQMKPMFFDQSASILFTDKEDQDAMNFFHQQQFNYVYGRRIFDSQNELLNEQRRIETVFAPTPVDQVLGAPDTSNFIIPVLGVADGLISHGSHTHQRRLPLRPKPRLLFWNGNITISPAATWYYTNGVTTYSSTQYPAASYLSVLPAPSPSASVVNLSWQKEFAYFSLNGGPGGDGGKDVYTLYWKDYIDSLYSSEARFLTAYFNLNAEDLRNLTFDDVIFIKDSYWRVHKIYDAPLTDIQTVKVDLIKLINYSPILGFITAPETRTSFPVDAQETPNVPTVFEESGQGPTAG